MRGLVLILVLEGLHLSMWRGKWRAFLTEEPITGGGGMEVQGDIRCHLYMFLQWKPGLKSALEKNWKELEDLECHMKDTREIALWYPVWEKLLWTLSSVSFQRCPHDTWCLTKTSTNFPLVVWWISLPLDLESKILVCFPCSPRWREYSHVETIGL